MTLFKPHNLGSMVLAAAAGLAMASAFAQSGDRTQSSQTQQSQSSQASTTQSSSTSATTFDELAQQHSNLSEFSKAVKAAGMEDSLAGGTKYTIFAPTNKAFDAMSSPSMDELLKPANRDQLVGVLRAHIVADDVDLKEARSLPAAETIDGGTVALADQNGTLMVGDAKLAQPQPIEMGNLRIYPIDEVLPHNAQSPAAVNR